MSFENYFAKKRFKLAILAIDFAQYIAVHRGFMLFIEKKR